MPGLGEILVHIKAIVILHCGEPSGLGREFLTAAAVGDGSRLGIPGGNVLIQEFFDGCHEPGSTLEAVSPQWFFIRHCDAQLWLA